MYMLTSHLCPICLLFLDHMSLLYKSQKCQCRRKEDRLIVNLLLLGRPSFSLEYRVMRNCSAFFWQRLCVSIQICCMGELLSEHVCRVLQAAVDKSCALPSLCHSNIICSFLSQEEELERLEREFAIQSQITEAARRLASDPHVNSKKLKKQRKTSYLNALKKLQEIENSINEYRVRSGKKPTQRASLIIEGVCFLDLFL